MYHLIFKNIKANIDIPSIKIESKEVFDDVAGGNGTILIDESFDNFTMQIYKATSTGKSKVDVFNRTEIEDRMLRGKDNIFNYWLWIRRNGKHKA